MLVTQVLHDIAAQLIPHRICVPAGVVEQPLHPIRRGLAGLLSQLPAILPLDTCQQATPEPTSAPADLHPAKARRDPLAQRLQLGCPSLDL